MSDRTSQGSAAPAESWEPLYDWWHKTAYRDKPKPTASQEIDRMQQFLKMVKKCECGKWHLEIGSDCKRCEDGKKKKAAASDNRAKPKRSDNDRG